MLSAASIKHISNFALNSKNEEEDEGCNPKNDPLYLVCFHFSSSLLASHSELFLVQIQNFSMDLALIAL
eukprot:c18672_g2_i1 orf=216-422(-)